MQLLFKSINKRFFTDTIGNLNHKINTFFFFYLLSRSSNHKISDFLLLIQLEFEFQNKCISLTETNGIGIAKIITSISLFHSCIQNKWLSSTDTILIWILFQALFSVYWYNFNFNLILGTFFHLLIQV